MTVKFSPWGNSQFVDATGAPASGYKIYTYAAGSSTPQTTYTDSGGLTSQSNPIVLNSLGLPTTGQIWLTSGQNYKLVWTDSNDVVKKTEDNISGVNDSGSTTDQWVASGLTPTYIGATQFSLAGDQTNAFTVGRRIKATVTAGTVYGYISVSAYAALTTITVVVDSGTLDSGLSAVSYGLLTPSNVSIPQQYSKSDNSINDFRLTLTTAVPVTTADVTGATTVYCTPYKGNRIALYDGALWNIRTTAEFSLALGTLTSGKPYDVFCYDNAGVPTLEFLVWTNDTTRATALVYQDGVLSKTGALTRRYMGTFYTTATTTTEDSAAKRYLWNYYNRVVRPMKRMESTVSWTYTNATFRQANGSTSNQLNMVIGVSEDAVSAQLMASGDSSDAGAFRDFAAAIGLDSTTVAEVPRSGTGFTARSDFPGNATIVWTGLIAAGKHAIVWLESSEVSGIFTWYSAGNCGLIGSIQA